MTVRPNNWREEERFLFAEKIADAIVEQMSLKELKQVAWDFVYEELMDKEWPDLWADAEEYAPELVAPLMGEDSQEAQRGSY